MAMQTISIVLVLLISNASVRAADLTPTQIEHCPRVTESCRPDFSEDHECAFLCDRNACTLRVGIILPNSTNYIVNAPQALVELQEVEEYARSFNMLPDRLNITYRIFDDRCEQADATIAMIDAYSQFCAHVIFGPICDYCLASTGRIVKYLGSYGTPLITAGGFSYDFVAPKTTCDSEFFMLINAGIADYLSFSEFFYLILAQYKWNQIALMYEKYDQNEIGGDQSCQLLMKAVIGFLKHQIPDVSYHDGDIWLQKITYEEYLTKTVGNQFGIVVMCMSHEHTRQVLIEAEKLGMTSSGEYAFINFDMYSNGSQPWYNPNDSEDNNDLARRGFDALITFAPLIEAENAVLNRTLGTRPGAAYLDGIYDGFLLYLSAIGDYLNLEDWTNLTMRGVDVVSAMFGRRFPGRREEVLMNCNGQRVARYALMQVGEEGRLQIIANYSTLDKRVRFEREIRWVGGAPPSDTPRCGYDNSKCSVNVLLWIGICVVPVFGTLAFFIYRFYKKYQIELELAADVWKINSMDLIPQSAPLPRPSVHRANAHFAHELVQQQAKCPIFSYHMNDVVVKYFQPRASRELIRAERMQLKKMKDLSHASLVKFYGACFEPASTCIVTEHCQRGSLLDVLKDEGIKLDAVFQLSLISDIALGMYYLHSNDITHGALKSTNCLIDAHFGVKIADFGLDFIRKHVEHVDYMDEEERCGKLIWTAPELLRRKEADCDAGVGDESIKKGDVYSFGIILHEIVVRKGPFYTVAVLTKQEIVDRVKRNSDAGHEEPPFRPYVEECKNDPNKLTDLMKECWAEDSDERPDFSKLKTMIRELNRDNKGNLVDNLLNRMEVYANNLESLVMDRTNDFLTEKKKCEDLLYQLLPKSVASQLISGQSVLAETFDQVTICFSDIVEFTKLSAHSTPLEVVDLLNDLYTCFDEVIGDFKVYKVETIGDAYLVVSGLPEKNGNQHASEIARMSLKLMETVREFKIRHRPGEPLKLRIGMHTGSCVAGVVGLKMPRYCLFGDTVNTASRMESSGQPLRIHVSADTKAVLDCSSPAIFELECRGEIDIKGKGKMTTYWLIRERTPPPPPPPSATKTMATTTSAVKSPSVMRTTTNGTTRSVKDVKRKDNDGETVPLLPIHVNPRV